MAHVFFGASFQEGTKLAKSLAKRLASLAK